MGKCLRIIVTHYHFDHKGCLVDLKDALKQEFLFIEILKVLVEAGGCAVRDYAQFCTVTAGKDHEPMI